MEKIEVSQPISMILDGTNYSLWSQRIKSFLIGRKLWRIVTGDNPKPEKDVMETQAKFLDRLDDWDSKNHQIITWFCNTSTPSIHIQFIDFETMTKEIWDFLALRYKTSGLAQYYQLFTTLNSLKQEVGQSINEFLALIQPIWNQLQQAEISKDHLHLIQVLMALRPEYESVRAALLHRDPLPSLDAAVKEILFEETRLGLVNSAPSSEVALATTQSWPKSASHHCKNCRKMGHSFVNCPTIECRYCHERGHIVQSCPNKRSRPKSTPKSASVSNTGSSVAAAVSDWPPPSPMFNMSDLEAIIKQVIPTQPTALSVTSGNQWFFDSGCCNHMTPNLSLLSNSSPSLHSLRIQTANGSSMSVTH
ncbi:hypothetical protein Scep_001722 [Stephania cephalantha]|uniref:CCHC-type domain-containing protein n=1 Tax=Stephania cephalantha TaxID=152367 RepID=A0AAP0L8Y0_9MAGN